MKKPVLLALLPFLAGTPYKAFAATITLDPTTRYQTISGWQAGANAGISSPLLNQYHDRLIDLAANDFGITRYTFAFRNPAGDGNLDFAQIDQFATTFVIPMKNKLAQSGQRLEIIGCYVGFYGTGAVFKGNPAGYAQLVLSAFDHMKNTYGWVPDIWDVELEPEHAQWTPKDVGDNLVAAGQLLAAHGYHPKFQAASTTSMLNAVTFFDTMIQIPNIQTYWKEYSYHRYVAVTPQNLAAIGQRNQQYHIPTVMSEWIGGDQDTLYEDLTVGNVSAWMQFVVGNPGGVNNPGGTAGGSYYWVDPAGNIYLSERGKYLRQYFKFIRPGAVRFKATTTNPDLDVTAFINTNGSYVVVANAAAAATFSIDKLPAGTYGIIHTTSGSLWGIPERDKTISAGQDLTVTIPAAGVITIYGKPGMAPSTDNTAPVISAGFPTANPINVQGRNTTLTVAATDNVDPANAIRYFWSAVSGVNFTDNTSNAASTTVASFNNPGTFTIQVRAADRVGNMSAPKTLQVTVGAAYTVRVTPGQVTLAPRATQTFVAEVIDQWNHVVNTPSFTWSVPAAGGTITSGGAYTASSTPGTYTITARDASRNISGMAQAQITGVTAPDTTAPVMTTGYPKATPTTTVASSALLNARATDNVDPTTALIYTWSGPAGVVFSPNGTNAAADTTARFMNTGPFLMRVTVKDTAGNTSAAASVTVTVNPTLHISVSPSQATVMVGGTKKFIASAIDQFTMPYTVSSWVWTAPAGAGTIDAQGNFIAAGTPGGPFTITAREPSTGATGTAQVTITASNPPQIALNTPLPGTTYTAPATIDLRATLTPGSQPMAQVQFLRGTTVLRTFTNPTQTSFSHSWTSVAAGTYDISVRVTDAQGAVDTDGPVTVTVRPVLNNPPDVTSIQLSPGDADPNQPGIQQYEGSSVVYQANVSDPNNNLSSWQWFYSLNGGPRIAANQGTAAGIASQSFSYAVGDAGKQYQWILQARDTQNVFTESSQSVSIIAAPAAPITIPVTASGGYSHLKVYPNPWRLDRHASTPLTFEGLTPKSIIRIYTVTGHLVREITTDGPAVIWDRKNSSGEPAASGLFLYQISNDAGDKTRGKFAIVH